VGAFAMKRHNAFAEMLLRHLQQTPEEQISDEIDSLALNVGGIICDAPIELTEEQEDEIIAALCAGMKEIIREYHPDMHLNAAPACGETWPPPA
jgi:hypothetical protein